MDKNQNTGCSLYKLAKIYAKSLYKGNMRAIKKFVLSIIIIVIIAYFFLLYFIDSDKLGTTGDYFGGILNPILAFLSLMALLKTISIQSKELKNSREELRLTREELAKSAEAQEKSAQIFEQQRFENTFFSLLETLNSNIINIGEQRKINNFSSISILIYQILKLVTNYSDNYIIQKQYSNILRAYMNDNILNHLIKHCANQDESFNKYRELIERYNFFEHCNMENHNFNVIKKYKKTAFGKNIGLDSY